MKNHNNFFTESFKHDKDINSMRNFILREQKTDENINKYISFTNSFVKLHPSKGTHQKFARDIVYNYWLQLVLYHKHIALEQPFVNKSRWNYCISSIRILELSIFLLNIQNDNLIKIFFDTKSENPIFFKHLQSLNFGNDIFDIRHLSDLGFTCVLLNQTEYYRSTINIFPNKSGLLSLFKYYFKLEHVYVEKIYNVEESENKIDGRNSRGQRGKKIPFGEISTLDIQRFKHGKNINKSFESNKESLARSNKIQSVLFNKNIIITDKEISNYDVSSPFKQYQINKAIGNSIAKNNMNLPSVYNLPHIKLLSKFIQYIVADNKNILETKIICLSLILGISAEKLIYAFLNLDENIKYNAVRKKLSIKTAKDTFANNIDNNITRSSNNDSVDLYLPQQICNDSKFVYDHIRESIDIKLSKDKLQSNIDLKIKDISKILAFYAKNFKKNIAINLKTLPKLSMRYYRILNDKSDINLLFIGQLTKSDKARVCYVSQRKQLYMLENWLKKFIHILDYNTTKQLNIFTHDDKQNWVGSPFFIDPHIFKNFILNLHNIKNLSEIELLNIKMIFLRYSLSILLATRDFQFSCDLGNYSRRESILTIQEKIKNLSSSKRIIPLSSKAIKYIDLFYKLKEKYNLSSFSPTLIELKKGRMYEIALNKSNVLEFIETVNTNSQFNDLKKFISKCPLNFGRHIFSTYASTSNVKTHYIDAFMNHFKFGLVDQGIYSNFNNQEYFKEIRELMKIIEKKYFLEYNLLEDIND